MSSAALLDFPQLSSTSIKHRIQFINDHTWAEANDIYQLLTTTAMHNVLENVVFHTDISAFLEKGQQWLFLSTPTCSNFSTCDIWNASKFIT